MTEPNAGDPHSEQTADSDSRPDIVFDEYWSAVSTDPSIDPDEWLRTRGGDAGLSGQLQLLAALRNAGADLAGWLSPSANVLATDAEPQSTRHPPQKPQRVPCLSPGELVDGKLRVLAELGHGGMGEVYVAWHPALEHEVAVKVLPSEQSQEEAAVSRFRRSITLHAKAGGHPNIVGVMDAGQHNGHMYLVMEYVCGIDLATLHKSRRPIPWREVCDWMGQTARGLEHAHRHNLVHRDIKPANLIRAEDGTIKLLDWGLARGANSGPAGQGATKEFVGMGTADYISPEQACDAASADAKSDLYSLGCTFYHLLAGAAPFAHHKTETAKVVAHSTEKPPSLADARPDVPPAVINLVNRLMEKEPRRRPAEAREVAEALELLLSRPPSKPWPNWLKAVIPVLLLCSVAAATYSLWPNDNNTITESIESKQSEQTNRNGNASKSISNILPKWNWLELIVAADVKSKTLSGRYTIVEDGRRLRTATIKNLGPQSAFAIEGKLSIPKPWLIVWIDTAGKFSFELNDEGDSVELKYPKWGMVTVNPEDPAGVQLILILALAEPKDSYRWDWDILNVLSAEPWTPPPEGPSVVWLNVAEDFTEPVDWRARPQLTEDTRGKGGTVDIQTSRSYLKMVESRLPKGVVPLAGFYLRTER